MIYLQLLASYLKIGFFGFGGGYAMLSLIQNEIVVQRGWLTSEQLTDIIAISQVTPGPIAINSATFVGMRIAGIPGALVATIGCVLPSCCVAILLAKLYLKYRNLDLIHGALCGLRPAVVALIASAGVTILQSALTSTAAGQIDLLGLGIFVAGLILLLARPKTDPIWVMLGAGAIGLAGYQCLPM